MQRDGPNKKKIKISMYHNYIDVSSQILYPMVA